MNNPIYGPAIRMAARNEKARTQSSAGKSIPYGWKAENPVLQTESTHLWVATQARDILQKSGPPTSGMARVLTAFWVPYIRGIFDPDWKNSAAGLDNGSWSGHFTSPRTGTTYTNQLTQVTPKGYDGKRLGIRHFDMAGSYAKQWHPNLPAEEQYGLLSAAFYHLGNVTHILEDISQPFHAHNAIDSDSESFGLHGKFEQLSLDLTNGVYGDMSAQLKPEAPTNRNAWTYPMNPFYFADVPETFWKNQYSSGPRDVMDPGVWLEQASRDAYMQFERPLKQDPVNLNTDMYKPGAYKMFKLSTCSDRADPSCAFGDANACKTIGATCYKGSMASFLKAPKCGGLFDGYKHCIVKDADDDTWKKLVTPMILEQLRRTQLLVAGFLRMWFTKYLPNFNTVNLEAINKVVRLPALDAYMQESECSSDLSCFFDSYADNKKGSCQLISGKGVGRCDLVPGSESRSSTFGSFGSCVCKSPNVIKATKPWQCQQVQRTSVSLTAPNPANPWITDKLMPACESIAGFGDCGYSEDLGQCTTPGFKPTNRFVWLGTAPFCSPSEKDCEDLGGELTGLNSACGTGKCCTSGFKRECRIPLSKYAGEPWEMK